MSDIENVIFNVAEALRVPVLILALFALAVTLIELGAFVVELLRRRRRNFARLEKASVDARAALERGDEPGAKAALRPVAWSTGMARTLAFMVDQWGTGQLGDRIAKGLADFDFRSLKRLERTRLLVRAGPALGLMGTLIPLSPALEGLARGDTGQLTENLRVAFSVTVLGLLIGAVAFGISLVRDRLYGQDLSDLEFVAATLAPDTDFSGGAAAQPRPAAERQGAAAQVSPPPPSASAAAGDKPPPPAEAKPLGVDLPPPGAPAPAAPAPAAGFGSAPAAPAPAAASPTPSGGDHGLPAAPAPTGGPSTSAQAPAPPTGGVQAPPIPEAPSPSRMPSSAPEPAPAAPAGGVQAPPIPERFGAPMPPPIPEAPTQALPPSEPAERPTQTQNHPPTDGHAPVPRRPEIQ